MSYEHRSNVHVKRSPFPLKLIGVIIVLLALLYFFAPNLLSGIFTRMVSPLWNVNKPDVGSVSAELENATILELQRENFALKEIMNRNASSTGTLAYILKKPPFTAYDSLIIDVGSENEITLGDKVFAFGNVLLGEVVEVNTRSSKVKLYSSYGEKYEVSIGVGTSTQNILATAIGRGGGSFEISLPRDVKVKVGDPITIPNLKVSVFGIVEKIVGDPARTFVTIYFSQPINIYEQKWVEIYK